MRLMSNAGTHVLQKIIYEIKECMNLWYFYLGICIWELCLRVRSAYRNWM